MIGRFVLGLAFLCAVVIPSVAMAQNNSITLPEIPYTPGDNSVSDENYRRAVAQSAITGEFMSGRWTFQPGLVVEVTFSDGAKESYTVVLNGTVYSVTPVANSYRAKPPAQNYVENNCAGGAAMAYAGSGGYAVPLYRATYLCTGNTCVLESAVLIGGLSLPWSPEQVVDAGGFCEAVL